MNDRISELEKRLESSTDDADRAEVLADLAWNVKYSDPSRAVELGNQALEKAASSGSSSPLPKAALAMAMGYLHIGKFEEAERSAIDGLSHYTEQDSPAGIRHALNVLGSIYNTWGRLGDALDRYLEAKRIDGELSDSPDPGIESNIGSVYMKLGDYEKALDYFVSVWETAREMEGPADLKAAACLNLGEAYRSMEMVEEALAHYFQGMQVCRDSDMKSYLAAALVSIGAIRMEQGDMIESLEQFEEALSIYNELGDRLGAASVMLNMGEVNLDLERHSTGLSFFNEALLIYREADYPQGMAEALLGVARSLFGMERYEDSLEKLTLAESITEEQNLKPVSSRVMEVKSSTLEALGRTGEALRCVRRQHLLERELHSEMMEERLLNLQISHQVEKSRKEAEIYKIRNMELSRSLETLEDKIRLRNEELQNLIEEKEFTQNVRRQLEMELGRDRRLASLGEIAGGIAHDFRNLLSVISGNTELVLASEELASGSRERMENVLEATVSGASLAGQLMSFGKQLPEEMGPLELGTIVENMIGMLERTVGEGIAIEKQIEDGGPPIMGDRLQIENLVVNLVLNARDAMPEGGVIRVALTRTTAAEAGTPDGLFSSSDRLLELSVTDQGHGIPKDDIDRVFDPFFTTRKATGGSGLGLSVVHSIVIQHKGWIKVESEPGRGSEFSVFFPEVRQVPEA